MPLKKELYGKFSSGDSYLVLKTNMKNNRLEWGLLFSFFSAYSPGRERTL